MSNIEVSLADFHYVALQEHNKYRRMNGLSDMEECPVMTKDAEAHAKALASLNKCEAVLMGKYLGSNVGNSYKIYKTEAVIDVIDALRKTESFDFLVPHVEEIGIGVSRNWIKNFWVVVFLYDVSRERIREERVKLSR